MHRILTALLLVLFVAVVPLAGASGETQVGCSYDSFGYGGQLTITGAAGKPYRAFNEFGAMVSQGMVTSAYYVAPVMVPSGMLHVRVGDEVFFTSSGTREMDWQ